jgi:hypothetical protein
MNSLITRLQQHDKETLVQLLYESLKQHKSIDELEYIISFQENTLFPSSYDDLNIISSFASLQTLLQRLERYKNKTRVPKQLREDIQIFIELHYFLKGIKPHDLSESIKNILNEFGDVSLLSMYEIINILKVPNSANDCTRLLTGDCKLISLDKMYGVQSHTWKIIKGNIILTIDCVHSEVQKVNNTIDDLLGKKPDYSVKVRSVEKCLDEQINN